MELRTNAAAFIERQVILENYRAAYDRANGRKAKLYMHGGVVYIDELPYRLKELVSMTTVLNERTASG